jgi:hypothetical protein
MKSTSASCTEQSRRLCPSPGQPISVPQRGNLLGRSRPNFADAHMSPVNDGHGHGQAFRETEGNDR